MPYKDREKQRQYQKQYYAQPDVKERRRKRQKHWDRTRYYNDPAYREKMKAKSKEYQAKHKEKYATDVVFRQKKIHAVNERSKTVRVNGKEAVLKLLGDSCILCNKKEKINFHEIHGKRHPYYNWNYHLEHIDDFKTLCTGCHTMVHRMIRVFNLTWDEILNLKSHYA